MVAAFTDEYLAIYNSERSERPPLSAARRTCAGLAVLEAVLYSSFFAMVVLGAGGGDGSQRQPAAQRTG